MKFPKYLTQTTVGKAVSVTPVTLVSISPCFQKILIISFTFNFQHKPTGRYLVPAVITMATLRIDDSPQTLRYDEKGVDIFKYTSSLYKGMYIRLHRVMVQTIDR